jgi:hypothetical protein
VNQSLQTGADSRDTPPALPMTTERDNNEVVIRHAVGKSTLKEGFTIPHSFEDWFEAPAAGQKRMISLSFDGQHVPATLRRLANARGHVQVKYENAAGRPFRNWLTKHFRSAAGGLVGEYIEISRVSESAYRIRAFPASTQPETRLEVTEWLFHGTDDGLFEQYSAAREIPAIIRNISFNKSEGQSYYNRLLSSHFADWNWESEKQVIPELPLKCDFVKDAVQVEVEFGNARTYYQDFVKFMLAHNRRTAEIGILVVPSEVFARQLCDVGRQRAVAKGRRCYSGMIHLEKVRRELKFLEFMLTMPIAIAGIGESRPASILRSPR